MEVNSVHLAGIPASPVRHGTGLDGAPPPAKAPLSEPQRPVIEIDDDSLTGEEQDYFGAAFPGAAKDIRQHVTYQKNGARPSATLGTVVDRKG
jgi:hypothetical protein